MKINRLIFPIVILSALCWACNGEPEKAEDSVSFNTNIDEGYDVVTTYSDSAEVKVMIESKVLQKHNDFNAPKEIFPLGLKVTFIGKDDKPTSWLKADYAVRDLKNRTIKTEGHVQFINQDQDKIQSHEIIYDEASAKVYSDKFVKITRPILGDTLYGVGFETDYKFQVVRIKRRNQGKLSVSKIE